MIVIITSRWTKGYCWLILQWTCLAKPQDIIRKEYNKKGNCHESHYVHILDMYETVVV